MKKLLLIILFGLLGTVQVYAQQPKLYLKAYGGIHVHRYVYRGEETITDVSGGWQGGFGFRVSYRQAFAELGFDFIRSMQTIEFADSIQNATGFQSFDIKLNSLNIPIKVGYIPIKTPFFKWYIYTGLGNRFNTSGRVQLGGEELRFKPREADLKWYNLDFLLGTQTDLGWLNIDFYYGTGITNSTRTGIRTNSHELILNLGFLF